MILSRIIEEKRREVDRVQEKVPLNELKEEAGALYIKSAFKRNISRKGHINLIAEIKKSSPSQGNFVSFDGGSRVRSRARRGLRSLRVVLLMLS